MKEYVEMGLLLDAISVSKLDYLKVTDVICKVPTADVSPVVHGEWIELYENNYECSACGDWWETIEGTPQDNGMSYCPHCGARMDGEK